LPGRALCGPPPPDLPLAGEAIEQLAALGYGLLLFMLASGLTLIFSMMGVLNFAHASFYMLGAYFGFQISRWVGFWPGLLLAPLLVGA
jgi:branched-chain amino acid transport system permease protein